MHVRFGPGVTGKGPAQCRNLASGLPALEQLGSEKAPVRLGGLYALERLAQKNPDQRQTIVNVLCAYLRMPYTLPDTSLGDDADHDTHSLHEKRFQEREVRLTAQRILTAHLNSGPDPVQPMDTFWGTIDLDLTGATLIDFTLTECRISTGRFTGATFIGNARFSGAMFTGDALFNRTTFTREAEFNRATFAYGALFAVATFAKEARFSGAMFTGDTLFSLATFASEARFLGTTFTEQAAFNRATFAYGALFNRATFTGDAVFSLATFAKGAGFSGATFTKSVGFDGAIFTAGVPSEVARFIAPLDEAR